MVHQESASDLVNCGSR